MQRSRNDVWVGLFVAIGAVAVLFLALKTANLLQWSFEKDYLVTAKFDNIGGLKPGAGAQERRGGGRACQSDRFRWRVLPGITDCP